MATTDEALARALEGLPGWQRHGDSIWRTYQFDDFATAALFVGRVADATAAAGHQPDVAIRGGRVTLELVPRTGTTLTADDLTVASRVQQLVG
ncbi:MAG TPA: 4a-hydroxytetrahydrobiopterin dehydratase, partial [Actinomycetota bacterium]|nr:4a-hydroxytetrahydrobiopterin dehydratase [Actinomycetota bacterium]